MLRRWNRKIRKFAVGMLDLPQDVIFDLPRLTMIGNRQVYIENHRGVIGFTSELLQLKLSVGVVEISGKDLVIRAILPEEVFIEGTISDIRYSG